MTRRTVARSRLIGPCIISILAASAAHASTVTMTIGTLINTSATGGTPTGSAAVTITDVAANEVEVTVAATLTSLETLTDLFLNVNESTPISSVAFTGTPVGPTTPIAFGTGSSFSQYLTTQTIVPAASTGSLSGKYDLAIKLPNGTGGTLRNGQSESFFLTGTGLSAGLFDIKAAQTGGAPTTDFYAAFAVTNALGTASSGTAVFGATSEAIQTSAVPLPGTLPLLLSSVAGLAALGASRRRNG